MRIHALLTLAGIVSCLTVFASAGQVEDRRFSATLSTAESAQTGLVRLSSDQVAVLDALVRHDAAQTANPLKPRPARFSQRLTADERRAAGITLLNEAELARIDHDVAQFINPPPSTSELAAPGPTTGETSLTSVMLRRGPEIHGSFSLMVGGGSHGYSEYGGAMTLNFYDPVSHLAIDVGYAEVHSSGGYGHRWCGYPGFGL